MAILGPAIGEWCNRQHATLWMSKLGFKSLFPSLSYGLVTDAAGAGHRPFAVSRQ